MCLIAVHGQIPVDFYVFIVALDKIEGGFREGRLQANAALLTGALFWVVGNFRLYPDAFGIAAPFTAQRAAFKKNNAADAWAVFKAVPLYINY